MSVIPISCPTLHVYYKRNVCHDDSKSDLVEASSEPGRRFFFFFFFCFYARGKNPYKRRTVLYLFSIFCRFKRILLQGVSGLNILI